jgi:hypothetical protein
VSYKPGRRGARRELLRERSRSLLRDLIRDRDPDTRLARIEEALLKSYTNGQVNSIRWRYRTRLHPQPEAVSADGS